MKKPSAKLRVPKLSKRASIILYILKECPKTTIKKLCWMLYTLDMEAYRECGKSLTGFQYIKDKKMPWPEGLEKTLNILIRKGCLKLGGELGAKVKFVPKPPAKFRRTKVPQIPYEPRFDENEGRVD